MELATLYKKSSKGKKLSWTIQVDGNVITSTWGEIGGKQQSTTDIISEGKNIGKANETTPEEQAVKEAQSAWEKKLKKDYVETLEKLDAGETSALIAGGIIPMTAHRYDKHPHKIEFPAYAQPKLDGHRCIAIIDKDGKCTLWSRSRKPILSMPHIIAELESKSLKNVTFDGELYNHDYRDKFEELTSLIRPDEAREGYTEVQYHVYDTVSNGEFAIRTMKLTAQLFSTYNEYVKVVDTAMVEDEAELLTEFKQWLADGYEGAMVRNLGSLYVNKRSYDLQKIKEFDDAEFKVVGVTEGRGKLKGHGIFICEVETAGNGPNETFNAKIVGDTSNLKRYLDHPKEVIGKIVTIQFQGYTNKAGVPRFPVALRLREDI